jgi:ABC-2 type transport system permease protein
VSVRSTAGSASLAGAPTTTEAAPLGRAVMAQTRAELLMTLRRGESVLVTVIMPAVFLLFFAGTRIVPTAAGKPIDFLLPGMLAVAIMSTGMVSLGIATAYERHYGVLKRLGSSPLPRAGLITAKLLMVLVVEVGQIVLLVLLAVIFYGWTPTGSVWAAIPIVLLGTATFAGLGMLMAGALRAEATLAGANGLYLVFLLIGGVVLPVDHLPAFLQWIARILPASALSDALRGALTPAGVPAGSVLLLLAWGIVILVAAALTFKWE